MDAQSDDGQAQAGRRFGEGVCQLLMVEFECVDCHIYTYSAGMDVIPDPPVCLVCQFIRESPEEDREALRKALVLRNMMAEHEPGELP